MTVARQPPPHAKVDTVSRIVRVDLDGRGYDIVLGSGVLDQAGALIADRLPGRPLIPIADASVAPLYLDRLTASLKGAGLRQAAPIMVPSGEGSKSFERLADLLDQILERGAERRTVLLALGGGVVGDLVGFAASIALRGLDFVQIPTTLLAQVDSAVGGKTGINVRQGKNLVGAFHQPRLTLSDLDLPSTLPRRELLAGYAEIVKYGLIDRPDFFAWLETTGQEALDGDRAARLHAVATSCEAKAAIVASDERETGLRALLNLGHTFGHALEAETGYGPTLLHGEAVAIGMVMAFDLSARLGFCPAADAARVRMHLSAVGLPVDARSLGLDQGCVPRLMERMQRDKKVKDGSIGFILADGLGKARLVSGIPPQQVAEILAASLPL
jgi:3-dehydroquinate synthase